MSDTQIQSDADFPDPYTIPLADINVAQAALFQRNLHWRYFERLRAEDPVHYCARSPFGPYWSVTKFKDIMEVDTHHQVYSSEGGITLGPPVTMQESQMMRTPMFIAMDPPKHDVQRATVSPVVAPRNLATLESTIRERAAQNSRRAAAQSDVQLGRTRVDRTDHTDARDVVRLSVRGSLQADALVGRRDRGARLRHRRDERADAATN